MARLAAVGKFGGAHMARGILERNILALRCEIWQSESDV